MGVPPTLVTMSVPSNANELATKRSEFCVPDRLIANTVEPPKATVLLTVRVPMVELATPTARVPPDWTITGPARTPVTIKVPPVMIVALV